MRPIMRLILGLCALAVILAGVALALPGHVTVARSMVINAPESVVFPYLNNVHRFGDWSPWASRDPELTVNYSGPDQGKGAKVEWTSSKASVGTGSMEGFVAWLRELGVPQAAIQARMAMLSEITGGSLLALGLFTRPACLLLVFTMIVAGRIGHRGAGYLITNDPPGAEYTINLAVVCACIALAGPGAWSLDALIFG